MYSCLCKAVFNPRFETLLRSSGYNQEKRGGKVTNIEYGNIDFENDIIELLTSTRS